MTEFKARASSWGSLFDCSHKWEGEHILGMKLPSAPRSLLGTAIHAGTAAFDQGRIDNAVLRPDDVAGIFIDALEQPNFEVDWKADDSLTQRDAKRIGLTLLTRYCLEISPRYTFVAVELETKPLPIDCGNGVTVVLTGTLDRARVIASDNGGEGLADVKTGRVAVEKGVAKTRGHKPQLGTYELLYQHTTGRTCTLPADIIGLKTSGSLDVATAQVHGARELMVGTEDHKGLIEFAAEMFRTGLFPPNNQSMLCSAKYCARHRYCFYKG